MDNNNGTPASIYTVAVAKGRDNTWDGAVDDLRINSKIYNFGSATEFKRSTRHRPVAQRPPIRPLTSRLDGRPSGASS